MQNQVSDTTSNIVGEIRWASVDDLAEIENEVTLDSICQTILETPAITLEAIAVRLSQMRA